MEDHLMEWTTSELQMDMLIGCVDRRIALLHNVRTYYDDSDTFQVAGIVEQSSETSYMRIANLQEVPFFDTVMLAINRMHGMGYKKYQTNLHWENRNRQEILNADTVNIDRRRLRFLAAISMVTNGKYGGPTHLPRYFGGHDVSTSNTINRNDAVRIGGFSGFYD